MGKDENCGLGGSVVSELAGTFPNQDGLNYHIVLNNFFTSPPFLWLLKESRIVATGTAQNPKCIKIFYHK